MGLFANILEKLGIKKPEQVEAKKEVTPTIVPPRPAPAKPGQTTHMDSRPNPNAIKPNASIAPGSMPKQTIAAIPEVDVVSKLEALAKANPQKLDWKVSIVDLLKLLDLDSSLTSRKELAVELGCPAEKIGGDYAEMNVWLHKEVLKRIAANGGNIPQVLLN
ncbi:MAG: oxidoreductase [Anaerolinea sp.]|nr:oxidoreductase [Anaerolinea sp.]